MVFDCRTWPSGLNVAWLTFTPILGGRLITACLFLLPIPVGSHRRPTIDVRVDTIDAYCKSPGLSHIGLLKIDAEGYDLQVFQGALQMFTSNRTGRVNTSETT